MIRTIVLAALAIALSARAEEPFEKKDPQSTWEARGKPGEGQKFLEKFVGRWDAVKKFFPKSGEPVQAVGECTQKMIHDGRFLQSEFNFQQGDIKTTGQGLIGYEVDSGLFTSNWTDSRQTVMSLRQSQDKFNGEEIVLYSKSFDPKSARRSRTVTRIDGDKITHKQFGIAPDGTERLMMELVMTRKN